MFAVLLKRVGSNADWRRTTADDWHPRMTSDTSAPAIALLDGQIRNPSVPGPWEKFVIADGDVDTYHAIVEIKHGAARRAQEIHREQEIANYEAAKRKVKALLNDSTVTAALVRQGETALTSDELESLRNRGMAD